MTEQEARNLKIGDSVVFAGQGGLATVNPYLTVGNVYQVGGSFHGQPCGKGIIIGIEMDDHGQDSWCYPDELILVGCNGNCGASGPCMPSDDGPYYIDDDCESEEFCKGLMGRDANSEPPCRCVSPASHDQNCEWKKWKDSK